MEIRFASDLLPRSQLIVREDHDLFVSIGRFSPAPIVTVRLPDEDSFPRQSHPTRPTHSATRRKLACADGGEVITGPATSVLTVDPPGRLLTNKHASSQARRKFDLPSTSTFIELEASITMATSRGWSHCGSGWFPVIAKATANVTSHHAQVPQLPTFSKARFSSHCCPCQGDQTHRSQQRCRESTAGRMQMSVVVSPSPAQTARPTGSGKAAIEDVPAPNHACD